MGINSMVATTFMCAIKSAALKKKIVPWLWCEESFANGDFLEKAELQTLDPKLLDPIVCGRECAAAGLENPKGSDIKQFMRRRSKDLLLEDSYWGIDSEFWQSRVGAAGASTLRTKVRACFPRPGDHGKKHETLQRLKAICDSMLAKFAPEEEAVWLKDLIDLIEAVAAGVTPKFLLKPAEANWCDKIDRNFSR